MAHRNATCNVLRTFFRNKALVPVLNRFTSGGVDHVSVDSLVPFPAVREYVARFMALEPVKAWYAAE